MGTATNARFRTTNWSLVASARKNRSAMGELLDAYWTPVYAYLRRSGHSRDDAADLTQGFIAEVVLRRGLVERADPDAGKFRAFLKSALRNFVVDQHRARAARRAAPERAVFSGWALDAAEPPENVDPSAAYDQQWAKAMLTVALARVRRDCNAEGLENHWRVFERRVLAPETYGGVAPTLEELAAEFNADSADAVSGMIFTVKRKLRAAIREAVAETVSTTSELDAELAALRRSLSG